MSAQMESSRNCQQSCIGQIRDVLCEGFDAEENMYFGRDFSNGPDVDGKIFFTAEHPATPGNFVRVKITDADDYDLFGKTV